MRQIERTDPRVKRGQNLQRSQLGSKSEKFHANHGGVFARRLHRAGLTTDAEYFIYCMSVDRQ